MLAKGKGVLREEESEGSRRQNPGLMNKNCIVRLMRGGRVCNTKQSPILSEPLGVNAAGRWDESYRSYPGRPDQYVGDDFFSEPTTCIVMYSRMVRSQQKP